MIFDLQQELKTEGTDWVTPEVPKEIVAELKNSPSLREHAEELVRGQKVQTVLAGIRQRQIKAASDRISWQWLDGLGRMHMRIDPEIYYRAELFFGKGCWRDRAFRKWAGEQNPELLIKSRSAKIFITHPGFPGNDRRSAPPVAHGLHQRPISATACPSRGAPGNASAPGKAPRLGEPAATGNAGLQEVMSPVHETRSAGGTERR